MGYVVKYTLTSLRSSIVFKLGLMILLMLLQYGYVYLDWKLIVASWVVSIQYEISFSILLMSQIAHFMTPWCYAVIKPFKVLYLVEVKSKPLISVHLGPLQIISLNLLFLKGETFKIRYISIFYKSSMKLQWKRKCKNYIKLD